MDLAALQAATAALRRRQLEIAPPATSERLTAATVTPAAPSALAVAAARAAALLGRPSGPPRSAAPAALTPSSLSRASAALSAASPLPALQARQQQCQQVDTQDSIHDSFSDDDQVARGRSFGDEEDEAEEEEDEEVRPGADVPIPASEVLASSSATSAAASASSGVLALELTRTAAGEVVAVPAAITARLRSYQQVGVRWMCRTLLDHGGALLGDDMGLGKTIQVIALLAALLGKTGLRQQDTDARAERRAAWRAMLHTRQRALVSSGVSGGGASSASSAAVAATSRAAAAAMITSVSIPGDPLGMLPILILCPKSVLLQWQSELQRWGWFAAAVLTGTPTEKQGIVQAWMSGQHEILISTPDTIRLLEPAVAAAAAATGVRPGLLIADEAHLYLRHADTQTYGCLTRLQAKYKLALTGTPLQNRLEELYDMLCFLLRPGTLMERSAFRRYYAVPIESSSDTHATARAIAQGNVRQKELQEAVLSKYMLCRKKTEVGGSLALPGKQELVVYCRLSPLQQVAYRRALAGRDCKLALATSAEADTRDMPKGPLYDKLHRDGAPCKLCERNDDGVIPGYRCMVLACLSKLQKIANHLELLKPLGDVAAASAGGGSSGSGAASSAAGARAAQAAHAAECDWRWAEEVLGQEGLQALGGRGPANLEQATSNDACGKFALLQRMLAVFDRHKHGAAPNKVILFSRSKRLLHILDGWLSDKYRGRYLTYTGEVTSAVKRAALVRRFNTDPAVFLMCVTTAAGGVGFNLTAANVVILMDPDWNPAADQQAQDRAYRIGQTRDVRVYRLLTQGTIEEAMYLRQTQKVQRSLKSLTGASAARLFDSRLLEGKRFLFSYRSNTHTAWLWDQYKRRLKSEGLLPATEAEPHSAAAPAASASAAAPAPAPAPAAPASTATMDPSADDPLALLLRHVPVVEIEAAAPPSAAATGGATADTLAVDEQQEQDEFDADDEVGWDQRVDVLAQLQHAADAQAAAERQRLQAQAGAADVSGEGNTAAEEDREEGQESIAAASAPASRVEPYVAATLAASDGYFDNAEEALQLQQELDEAEPGPAPSASAGAGAGAGVRGNIVVLDDSDDDDDGEPRLPTMQSPVAAGPAAAPAPAPAAPIAVQQQSDSQAEGEEPMFERDFLRVDADQRDEGVYIAPDAPANRSKASKGSGGAAQLEPTALAADEDEAGYNPPRSTVAAPRGSVIDTLEAMDGDMADSVLFGGAGGAVAAAVPYARFVRAAATEAVRDALAAQIHAHEQAHQQQVQELMARYTAAAAEGGSGGRRQRSHHRLPPALNFRPVNSGTSSGGSTAAASAVAAVAVATTALASSGAAGSASASLSENSHSHDSTQPVTAPAPAPAPAPVMRRVVSVEPVDESAALLAALEAQAARDRQQQLQAAAERKKRIADRKAAAASASAAATPVSSTLAPASNVTADGDSASSSAAVATDGEGAAAESSSSSSAGLAGVKRPRKVEEGDELDQEAAEEGAASSRQRRRIQADDVPPGVAASAAAPAAPAAAAPASLDIMDLLE